jgi:hypothetical protein
MMDLQCRGQFCRLGAHRVDGAVFKLLALTVEVEALLVKFTQNKRVATRGFPIQRKTQQRSNTA